jgi:hypothetical protein
MQYTSRPAPAPKKARKKTFGIFIIAFELSIVFCSPWQGEQSAMPSSKAIKKDLKFFFGPFWAQGVTWAVHAK